MGQPVVESDLMTIGTVLEILQSEFPDTNMTVSKIRFLESEGLVTPVRTPTGYRKFSPADVNRLRYTLRMQRDHFLPLRVIKDNLDKLDRGFVPNAPNDQTPQIPSVDLDDSAVIDIRALDDVPVRVSLGELRDETGLSVADIIEIGKLGIIRQHPQTQDYGAEAVSICRLVVELQECGLDARHLRPLVTAAQRQADLAEQLIDSQRGGDGEPTQEITDVTTAILRLHSALVHDNVSLQASRTTR